MSLSFGARNIALLWWNDSFLVFHYLANDIKCQRTFVHPSFLRANIVVQCENWWNLAKQFASRSPPLDLLSSSVQRTLMKALVLGGFAHMDSDTKQQYWTEVGNPIEARDNTHGIPHSESLNGTNLRTHAFPRTQRNGARTESRKCNFPSDFLYIGSLYHRL